MKLTPLDIRHKEFHRGMRGYADAEVDEFLDMVADEYERIFKEKLDLSERLEGLQQQLDHYRGIETTLQKTLLSAQQSAEDMRASAQKEAQLVLRDAEVKGRDTLSEAYAARQQVEREIVMLKNAEAEYRFRFRALLEGYLKQITQAEGGAHERVSQYEQQAQVLRDALVAEGGTGRASGPGQAAPTPSAPQGAGRPPSASAPAPERTMSGPSRPPDRIPTHPATPAAAMPPAPGPPAGSTAAPPPQLAVTADAAAATAPPAMVPVAVPATQTAADTETEDTAVIAGIDHDVDVRPLTEEEDDFFSNVDDGVRGNEFKW